MTNDLLWLRTMSKQARLDVLRLAHAAGRKGAHISPSLSIVEIMTVLLADVMRPGQDLFVLSKGHGGLGYYAAMRQAGLITEEQLNTFEIDGGDFPGQPARSANNHVIYSSGTLGLGLPYAAGRAWAARAAGEDRNLYVLLGDGELNEGCVWEAAMFARQQRLDNLTAVVDWNGMQSDGFSKDIIEMDLEAVWKAFGWEVICCPGHDVAALREAFSRPPAEAPIVVLAKTVKGKGVSFMENDRAWHHNRLEDAQYKEAVAEVESGYEH